MNRRNFFSLIAAGVAGIALEQAIPFGRVWSFPSKIIIGDPLIRVFDIQFGGPYDPQEGELMRLSEYSRQELIRRHSALAALRLSVGDTFSTASVNAVNPPNRNILSSCPANTFGVE